MPIDIESREYECWHEAGHAVVCLLSGGKVEFVEIIKEKGHFGRARARCETTDDNRCLIACGGFAAEYQLYRSGMLDVTESVFVKNALINAFPDKVKFFGADYVQEDGCWPAEMDVLFRDFAIFHVAPIIKKNLSLLSGLANSLLEKEYLNEDDISQITRKHNY